ncbi:MAG: hypothetical protein ACRCX2_21980 [Paraclostridium sp.]
MLEFVPGLLLDVYDMVSNKISSKSVNQKSNIVMLPLIVSDDIGMETAIEYSKCLEVYHALLIKSILEGVSRSRFDDSVKTMFLQLPFNTSYDDAKMFSTFGAKLFGDKSATSLASVFAESLSQKLLEEATDIRNVKLVSGESGQSPIVGNTMSSVPTYISIELTVQSMGKTYIKKFMVGVQVTPRLVPSEQIAEFIGKANVSEFDKKLNQPTKAEMFSWNMFRISAKKNEVELKKDKVLPGDTKKRFFEMMNIVKKSNKPLVNLLISDRVHDRIKELGFDFKNKSDYSKLFSKFPLDSIGILNLNTDVIEFSIGNDCSYGRYMYSDFVTDVSRYEKELANLVRFNQFK